MTDTFYMIESYIRAAEDNLAQARSLLGVLKQANGKPVEASVSPSQVQVVPSPSFEASSALPVSEELIINDEWQKVLDDLHHGSDNLFITGGAGTGKSTLLRHFVGEYQGSYAIVAPTGVAALRVSGETIHHFFKFPATHIDDDSIRDMKGTRDEHKYKRLDTVIIDEISMVWADLMDGIDRFLRRNGPDKAKPFGGVRIISFGDPYQLPPVSRDPTEKRWLGDNYGTESPYFFHAQCWRDAPAKLYELTTIFRQADPVFTAALNAIRANETTPEHIALINSRVNRSFRPPQDGDRWLTLTTTNNSAANANQRMLSETPGKSRIFEAKIQGDFNLNDAPTDQRLELKVGLTVMFIKGAALKGYVNGTLGTVTNLDPLTVSYNGHESQVEVETWESLVYEYDREKNKLVASVKGAFEQVPLKLAAAITIHKSQGLSLDRVIIDFGNGSFAAGQSYVALSRCRSLEGMVLRYPLMAKDLIVSPEVVAFMHNQPLAQPKTRLF